MIGSGDEPRVTVVVFAPYYPPAVRAGGPVKSISQLVSAAAGEFETRVVTRNRDLGSQEPLSSTADRWDDADGRSVWRWSPTPVRYVQAVLAAFTPAPRIVYVNSLFDPWTGLVPAVLWRLRLSRRSVLVLAPRGQLGASALTKSSRKKRALLTLWRRVLRGHGAVLHAATHQEAQEIAGTLGGTRVVVRSNEVGPMSPTPAVTAGNASDRRTRAVFLGRLVPIKGLLELLVGLRRVREPLDLDVYGPEEDGNYVDSCRNAASGLPSWVTVTFHGPLPNAKVVATLTGFDLMLNPTRGESFGQAIGEALAAGTPVAVPPVTPWTDVIEGRGGGWVVRQSEWADVVDSYAREPRRERLARRAAARRAYEEWWQAAQTEPHVFSLALEHR